MFFDFEDSRIRYTGRWGKQLFKVGLSRIVTTATGSKITFAFTGRLAVMHFDMRFNQQPYGHLWVQVDGGSRVETILDTYLRVQAAEEGVHTVEVIYKGGVEMQHRWHHPLVGRVAFLGVEAEDLAELPPCNKKTIEFVGDSITEGVLIDAECQVSNFPQNNRPLEDDVCATYAYLTAEALNLEPLFMGYGAVGLTRNGQGGVPDAVTAYPYCFEDCPVSYSSPDYVLINHGANDRAATPERYLEQYEKLLDLVRRTHPQAQIIMVSPFCGAFAEELDAFSKAYNAKNGAKVLYVNTKGWISPEPLHPLRDGHQTVAKNLTAILKKELGL